MPRPHLESTRLRLCRTSRDQDSPLSLGFHFELLPPSLAQAVVFRAAVLLGVSPKGGNPAFFLRPVQSGKELAGLTTKVPAVICWILREIPNPCISPAPSEFKISRSNVPCKRVVGAEFRKGLLSPFCRYGTERPIECQ